jgi:hypothetical protein
MAPPRASHGRRTRAASKVSHGRRHELTTGTAINIRHVRRLLIRRHGSSHQASPRTSMLLRRDGGRPSAASCIATAADKLPRPQPAAPSCVATTDDQTTQLNSHRRLVDWEAAVHCRRLLDWEAAVPTQLKSHRRRRPSPLPAAAICRTRLLLNFLARVFFVITLDLFQFKFLLEGLMCKKPDLTHS